MLEKISSFDTFVVLKFNHIVKSKKYMKNYLVNEIDVKLLKRVYVRLKYKL